MLLALLRDLSLWNFNLEFALVGSSNYNINLGKTFAHFLLVYGEQFSTQHFCIDENSEFAENQTNVVINIGLFNPQNTVLQVCDPIDNSNNVGKQTYNFNLVQD